jgi:hypothetical protein
MVSLAARQYSAATSVDLRIDPLISLGTYSHA